MRHLDLFSGIGGFALAASHVWGAEYETAAFCDVEPFAIELLSKRFPNVPIINDIRNINREIVNGTVDLVTGGFPCQPFSASGKRKGTTDDRYLWPEMLRVIAEFQPAFVLGENVSGIYTIDNGLAFEQVCVDLENAGYEVWPLCIPACALDADHRRDRWWFAAYSKGKRRNAHCRSDASEVNRCLSTPWRSKPANIRAATDGLPSVEPSDDLRTDDGIPGQLDRLKALGNAIVPQVAAQILNAMKVARENANV